MKLELRIRALEAKLGMESSEWKIYIHFINKGMNLKQMKLNIGTWKINDFMKTFTNRIIKNKLPK